MNSVDELAAEIRQRQAAKGGQLIVAIAGAPGSGKSTLADILRDKLNNAIVVPMDGYHLDNLLLEERGLMRRKGSPETFDAVGLSCLLDRLTSGRDVIAPVFDRQLDLARAGAIEVKTDHDFVLVEGNYLLLNEDHWIDLHKFWDLSLMIEIPKEALKERLVHRWLVHGDSVERANSKASQNDLPNADRVYKDSIKADLTFGKLTV